MPEATPLPAADAPAPLHAIAALSSVLRGCPLAALARGVRGLLRSYSPQPPRGASMLRLVGRHPCRPAPFLPGHPCPGLPLSTPRAATRGCPAPASCPAAFRGHRARGRQACIPTTRPPHPGRSLPDSPASGPATRRSGVPPHPGVGPAAFRRNPAASHPSRLWRTSSYRPSQPVFRSP